MVGLPRLDRSPRSRALRLGVGAAAILAFALAALWAVTTPPFAAVDEAAHVGYALAVASGDLPTLDTVIPARDVPGLADWLDRQVVFDPHRLVVWTSNHPPLPYVLLAPSAVWAAGGSLTGLVAMRLTMAAALAAAVGATGWLAREVVPSRPSVALTAAATVAVLPPLVQHSGLVFTDAVLLATGTATLAAAVRVLRRGPSPRLLTLLALLATAAALSRATGVIIAGLAVGAVAVAGWRRAGGPPRDQTAAPPRDATAAPPREQARQAVRTAAPVAAVIAVGGAWFYVRNWIIMGGPAGTQALLELANRQPRTSVLPALLNPAKWAEWARYQLQLLVGPEPSLWPLAVLLLGLAAVALATTEAVRRAGGPAAVRGVLRRDVALAWAWALLAALVVICAVTMFQWWTEGGNPHVRYLYPAVPVLAVAFGLVASTWPARVFATAVAFGGAAVTVALVLEYRYFDLAPDAATVWTAAALAAAATVAWAGAELDRRPPPADGGRGPEAMAGHAEAAGRRGG